MADARGIALGGGDPSGKRMLQTASTRYLFACATRRDRGRTDAGPGAEGAGSETGALIPPVSEVVAVLSVREFSIQQDLLPVV